MKASDNDQKRDAARKARPRDLTWSQQTRLQHTWRRFRQHRMAVAGAVYLVLLVFYVGIGTQIYTQEQANQTNLRARWQPPSAEHPLGTDSVGRDVLIRSIYGGRVSLMVGGLAAVVTAIVGTTLGLVAGYFGGWVDSVIMRFAEALISIPLLFLLLALSRAVGDSAADMTILGTKVNGSVLVLVLILGFTGWMRLARIVRANTLSLKQSEFVLAAHALGARHHRIILRYILPNTLAAIIVFATLSISTAILLESYVSFLGFGVQPPTASWGNMLQRAVEKVDSAPWLWIFPGFLTAFTIVSVNFIGDALRDALDSSTRS